MYIVNPIASDKRLTGSFEPSSILHFKWSSYRLQNVVFCMSSECLQKADSAFCRQSEDIPASMKNPEIYDYCNSLSKYGMRGQTTQGSFTNGESSFDNGFHFQANSLSILYFIQCNGCILLHTKWTFNTHIQQDLSALAYCIRNIARPLP